MKSTKLCEMLNIKPVRLRGVILAGCVPKKTYGSGDKMEWSPKEINELKRFLALLYEGYKVKPESMKIYGRP
mgnify:CR=1 FL=1